MDEDPSYDICVAVIDRATVPIDPAPLRQAIEHTLRRQACPCARISVALVNDARIAELNHRHLGHDGPTDVLTFNLTDNGQPLNAEIVISAETAARQAQQRNHPATDELALYAVHGTLHLMGMDDHTAEEADAMHTIEDEILSALGHGAVYGGKGR